MKKSCFYIFFKILIKEIKESRYNIFLFIEDFQYLNDKLININSFEDYIKLYTDEYFFEANKEKTWALGIAISENGFQQISFANSTETYDGGTHVDYIMNQIVVQLREFFLKKHKVDIKPNELKSHMTLFLDQLQNCLLDKVSHIRDDVPY